MTSTSLTVIPGLSTAARAARQPPRNAPPVLKHALKAGALQSNWMACAAGNMNATAQALAYGFDAEDVAEFWRLQEAAWRRLSTMQAGWMRDWQDWFVYSGQINGANTMSKLIEREGNIAAQFTQILGTQITSLVALQENILVDYSWWIHEKAREKQRASEI